MALRNLVTTGGTCLRNTIFRRCLSLTPRTLGGGHHAPIPEPYVPKPRDTSERDWLGRRKLPRLSKDSHEHTMDDYQSYIGGAVFVLLTLGAVAFYTDVFGMNIKKNFKHAHHKEVTTSKHAESTHSHSEEPEKPKPKPAPPVVQEKPAPPAVEEKPAEKKAPEATDKVVEVAGSSKEKADDAGQGSKTTEPAAQNSDSPTESSSETKETTPTTDEQKSNESTSETKHDDSQKPPCHDKPADPKPKSSNSEST